MTVPVKVFGERNSGTNFLSQVLERHFDVSLHPDMQYYPKTSRFILTRAALTKKFRHTLNEGFFDIQHYHKIGVGGGWKHAMLSDRFFSKFAIPKQMRLICIVRHPLAWARSMHRLPFHNYAQAPMDYQTFIQSPWRTRRRDGLKGATLESPLQLWNLKLQSYVDFSTKYPDLHIIKYEDLLLDTEHTVAKMSAWFPRNDQEFSLPENHSRNFIKSDKTLTDYIKIAKETSFDTISRSEKDLFTRYIDPALLARFNYT